jgi:hypothetical protein
MAREINWIPVSLAWFALTAIIYILQLIPFTGIFLMLAMAPLWSILTVNLGFLSLAVEAGIGKASRWWLLAPVAWFGGYAAFAYLNHSAIDALDRDMQRDNATQSIAFDPARHALVIDHNAADLSTAAGAFVHDYGLSVAYVAPQPESKRKSQQLELAQQPARHRAHRLAAGEACKRLADPRLRAAHIYPGYHFDRKGDRKSLPKRTLCSYALPEDVDRPAIQVAAKSENLKSFWLSAKITRVTLTAPDGRIARLRAGYTAPYAWLPMPVIGCGLNSGAASWDCFADFWRGKTRGLGAPATYGGATITVTAKALGLQSRPALERYDTIAAAGAPTLDNAVGRSERRSLDNLEAVLANPALRATVHDLNGLAEQPGVLVARADRILSAMSAGYSAKGGLSETGRNMQRLLAALPAADFQRIGPALIEAIERGWAQSSTGKRHTSDPVDGFLATRLGDLGQQALPLLMRLTHRNTHRPDSAAIYGICRIGPAAVSFADQLVAMSSALRRHDDAFQAIYVTLLRLGRSDFADQMVPADEAEFETRGIIPVKISRFPALRRAITPASPPTVCSHQFRGNERRAG